MTRCTVKGLQWTWLRSPQMVNIDNVAQNPGGKGRHDVKMPTKSSRDKHLNEREKVSRYLFALMLLQINLCDVLSESTPPCDFDPWRKFTWKFSKTLPTHGKKSEELSCSLRSHVVRAEQWHDLVLSGHSMYVARRSGVNLTSWALSYILLVTRIWFYQKTFTKWISRSRRSGESISSYHDHKVLVCGKS